MLPEFEPWEPYDDPIVAEVRSIRERFFEQVDFDLHKFVSRLIQKEQQHPERLLPAFEPMPLA